MSLIAASTVNTMLSCCRRKAELLFLNQEYVEEYIDRREDLQDENHTTHI